MYLGEIFGDSLGMPSTGNQNTATTIESSVLLTTGGIHSWSVVPLFGTISCLQQIRRKISKKSSKVSNVAERTCSACNVS